MELYLKRRNSSTNAIGDYDIESGTMIVKKGSTVSESVHSSDKFRGATAIQKLRDLHCKGLVVKEDVKFSSASTAANFVAGGSTNGLVAWRNSKGEKLRDIIKNNTSKE